MMVSRARRRLKHAIIRSRFPLKGPLARAALRVRERVQSLHNRNAPSDRNGLVLPSPRLRVLVAGTAEVDVFVRTGEVHAGYLRELLARAGRPIRGLDSILDFGCGCGRIARWFSDLPRTQINGCDYNDALVAWCRQNLAFMHTSKTALYPPLPYADESFDFLYAYSVFTHLSVNLTDLWMRELRRVVKPGGLVWFTVHGESYSERLLPEQRTRFEAGEVVVWLPEIEGTNLCCAYWPRTAVKNLLGSDFEVLDHLDPKTDPETARKLLLEQDAYLVRRN
jgi:SAM-dependent methyltransferase